MQNRSLRTYLIVVLLSAICLSNFIAALHGYQKSLSAADQLVDSLVSEKARSLARLVSHGNLVPSDLYDRNTFFQVWNQNQLLTRSDNAPDGRVTPAVSGYHFASHNGLRWRTILFTEPRHNIQIVVAQRFDVYSRLSEDILLKAILPIIWVLPLVAVLVWIIVSIGLKPLKRLAGLLNGRSADDFSALDQRKYPAELTSIVSSLNSLFHRLNRAFEREKRFSADAAHELRTPLAALKVDIHNLSKTHPQSPDIQRLKASADRLGHSLEQMLALNRITAGQPVNNYQYCELESLAKQVITRMFPEINARQQHIELISAPVLTAYGEKLSLAIMLRNLIDNASKYSPREGDIRVEIHNAGDTVHICVEDSGPGIPEQEYERVADRFYRIGGDRNNSGITGSGLGLSIVKLVVEQHAGEMHFGSSDTLGGLAVSITLPKEPGVQVQ